MKYFIVLFFLLFFSPSFSQQCNLLCNSDFDDVQFLPPSSIGFYVNGKIPCWRTTASDSIIEMWSSGFGGVPLYSGNQFIELNAYMFSTLYQNFTASAGTSLNVSFAHRGRSGVDTMTVQVGPVGGPYTTLGRFGTGNTAWGFYTVNYTIPPGMGNYFSLRFTSVYTASGNATVGNFLDAISVALPSSLFSSTSGTDLTCFGTNDGTASVSVTGGTSPYQITWQGLNSTSSTVTNLSQGVYAVSVMDGNGCVITDSVTITQPDELLVEITSGNASCNGASDGFAQVSVSGGSGQFTYQWSSGLASQNFVSGLNAGAYVVEVTDSSGCSKTESVTIAEPAAINPSVVSTNISCFGLSDGTASLSISGGTSPYQVSWNGTNSTSLTLSGLSAGSYSAVVTDANNCSTNASLVISEPDELLLTSSVGNISCNSGTDGYIQVVPSGGTGAYFFDWSPSLPNQGLVSGVSSGVYTVIVSDSNGCSNTDTLVVTEPTIISSFISVSDVSCYGANDGTASLTISGGVSPYQILWAGLNSTSPTLTNLAPGAYVVTVTDSNNCSESFTIPIAEPSELIISTNGNDITCNGQANGMVQVGASGGVGPYNYQWSGGLPNQVSNSGVPAGTYSITVTDVKGCSKTDTLIINEPQPLILNISTLTGTTCGEQNGAVTVFAAGGNPGYTFQWSHTTVNSNFLDSLSAGNYSVAVIDSSSCSDTISFSIAPSNAITPVFSHNGLDACGSACVDFVTDYPADYDVNWNVGGGNFLNGNVVSYCYSEPGIYSVNLTVSDTLGCSGSFSASDFLQVFPNPEANFTLIDTVINYNVPVQFTNLSINTDFWQWDFGDNSGIQNLENPIHTFSDSGKYIIELISTNNFGCSDTIQVPLEVIKEDNNIFVPNTFTPNSDGFNDVFYPVVTGIEEDSYNLEIYTRWGELIFKTNDPKEGWDGRLNGIRVQIDTYVWKITFIDQVLKERTHIGHVNVIR